MSSADRACDDLKSSAALWSIVEHCRRSPDLMVKRCPKGWCRLGSRCESEQDREAVFSRSRQSLDVLPVRAGYRPRDPDIFRGEMGKQIHLIANLGGTSPAGAINLECKSTSIRRDGQDIVGVRAEEVDLDGGCTSIVVGQPGRDRAQKKRMHVGSIRANVLAS